MVNKGDPFYLKFWVNRAVGSNIGSKSPILNRYSLVAHQP